MKKIILSLAALVVVAITTFTFTSCGNDNDEMGGILLYSIGFSSTSLHGSDTAIGQIEKAYQAEFKKISNATVSGTSIQFPYGSSSSTYNSQILSACQAAEATINSTVTLTGWGNATYHVYCDNSSKEIYTKKWGE